MADNVLGLDLSHHRAGVPIRIAKKQGVRFIISKCTEGTTHLDSTYEDYKLETKNKYLPFGSFMYWRVIYDAVGQAEWYAKKIGKTDFPPIVDVERYLNRVYGTNTPLRPISTNRNHLRIVLNVIEEKTGRKPMIYTNFASWRCLMGDAEFINEYECWVASWGRYPPYLPVPLKKWRIQQFTNVYKVEGYTRGVDANWFNGDEADFEKWLASMNGDTPPLPPPPPDPEQFGFFWEFKGEKWQGLAKKVN